MSKFDKKLKAHKLRRQGHSIKSITEMLSVSKSSASIWCSEIKLTARQQSKLLKMQIASGHKGRLIGANMNKLKKERNIQEQSLAARQLVGTLTERDKLMLGIGLYWGEGTKTDASATSIANSDPDIIVFAKEWFISLGVRKEDLSPYIFISEIHKSRERQILSYWAKTLKMPKSQLHGITYLKGRPKKVYENHNLYYGIVALRVRKGTSLKYKIRGMIECCKPA